MKKIADAKKQEANSEAPGLSVWKDDQNYFISIPAKLAEERLMQINDTRIGALCFEILIFLLKKAAGVDVKPQ